MRFWVVALFLSYHLGIDAKHNNGLTYTEFSSILSSEIDNEVSHVRNVDTWWRDVVEFNWDNLHNVERKRRKLLNQEKSSMPFLICSKEPYLSGHSRIEKIKVLAGIKKVMPLINNEKKTCVATGVLPRDAEILESDTNNNLFIIPFVGGMKIRSGVYECVNGQQINGCGSLDSIIDLSVEVGDWAVTETTSSVNFANEILQQIQNLFSSQNSLRKLSEESPSTIWFDLAYRQDNSTDHRSLTWRNAVHSIPLCDFNEIIQSDTNINMSLLSYSLPVNLLGKDCAMGFLAALSMNPKVASISLDSPIEAYNTEAQWIIQSAKEGERPWFDMGLSGQGQVVSISDSGLDVDNCYFNDNSGSVTADSEGTVDLSRRKVVQYYAFADDTDTELGHGTHTAGTLAGRKEDGPGYADGIARDAKIAFFDLGKEGKLSLPNDLNQIFQVGLEADAMIHSASWGRFAGYQILSKTFDNFMYEHENYLAIFSAGNAGGPTPSIGEPGNAKNLLTVGASMSSGRDLFWYDQDLNHVTYFSSHGPVDNGNRIKPDIIAPGRHILSAGARPDLYGECDGAEEPTVGKDINEQDGLDFSQGTSMSAPVVAGAAAMVRQYFQDGYYPTGEADPANSLTPTGSLIKAILLNGGTAMTGVDHVNSITPSSPYDGAQGFGLLSLINSLPLTGKNTFSAYISDRASLSDGESKDIPFNILKKDYCDTNVLSITLVWTDPAAAQGCISCVLNDLDIHLTDLHSGKVYFPNGLQSKDSNNNVERIRVEAKDGDRFMATISAVNLVTPQQKYSLVATGCLSDEANTSSPTSSPSLSPTIQAYPVPMSLDTLYDSQGLTGLIGVMFRIKTSADILITSFDLHIGTTEKVDVQIYTKVGSYKNRRDRRPTKWTKIVDTNVSGEGVLSPTHVVVQSLSIKSKTPQSFYIVSSSKDLISSKVDENIKKVYTSDSNMKIFVGSSTQKMFKRLTHGVVWNGAINYTIL